MSLAAKLQTLVLAMLGILLGQSVLAAPAPGASWDWQLSEPVRPVSVAVFDTDPDLVSPGLIAGLNASGVYTICYVSVGTLEDYRADAGLFPAEVIGKIYGDWPDERFLDIRQTEVLVPLMKARFQRCLDMGFAAIEPDNMDVHDNESGFDVRPRDTVRYVSALAKLAHDMGLEIGQKNVPGLTMQLVQKMDFAVTESCFQDGWCDLVSSYESAGKPVFDAEYTDEPIDFAKACRFAGAARISMILKDRDLHAGGQRCNE